MQKQSFSETIKFKNNFKSIFSYILSKLVSKKISIYLITKTKIKKFRKYSI